MILIGFVLLFSALIYSVHSNMMIKRLESKNKSALESFLKNTDEDEDADNSEIVADNSESDAIHKARREYGDAYDESDRVDNRPKARRQQHSNAVAFLSIKKLNLDMPVFPGTTDRALRAGAGIVAGTDFPHDSASLTTVIAGHRGGHNGRASFLHIDKLTPGDEIRVITVDRELVYHVTMQEVIEPTDWSKFTRSENTSRLILMTCHPYPQNNKRLLVCAELFTASER